MASCLLSHGKRQVFQPARAASAVHGINALRFGSVRACFGGGDARFAIGLVSQALDKK